MRTRTLSANGAGILGKIAGELRDAVALRARTGSAEAMRSRRIGQGPGWVADDVICTAGPSDRSYEEKHSAVKVAVVIAGAFEYRAPSGRTLLTPGSLLLGNPGECFECGHTHGAGDRCVSFRFEPETFAELASDLGVSRDARKFGAPSVPVISDVARDVARAASAAASGDGAQLDEVGLQLASTALRLTAGRARRTVAPPRRIIAQAAEQVRRIEAAPALSWSLPRLARDAGQSPFQFLRAFKRVTGVTPHQFVLRTRLRAAALLLIDGPQGISDVASASGFNDLSNFNHAFRAEFGLAPREYRASARSSHLRTE
jgi:AraC family transcriptional regulator